MCTTRLGPGNCFPKFCIFLAPALEPPPGKSPAFAQLYVLDNYALATAVKGMQFGGKLKEDLLVSLAEMLKQENAYVRVFRPALGKVEIAIEISNKKHMNFTKFQLKFFFEFAQCWFRQAAAQDVPELQVHIYGRPGPQARSYNRPRAAEIAVFIPSERSAEVQSNPRDIVVHRRGGGLQAVDWLFCFIFAFHGTMHRTTTLNNSFYALYVSR